MDERARPNAVTAALGWGGSALPLMTLFGCRFRPVIAINTATHVDRVTDGVGPQLDDDVLAIWEWPESRAPGSPVALRGALFEVGGVGWRRPFGQARRWSAFSPTVLVDPTGSAADDEWCRWECGFAGTGLVDVSCVEPTVRVAAEDRGGPGGRVTADRWVEERLYSAAIQAGLFPAGTGALTDPPRPGPGRRASSVAPSARSSH